MYTGFGSAPDPTQVQAGPIPPGTARPCTAQHGPARPSTAITARHVLARPDIYIYVNEKVQRKPRGNGDE